MTSIERDSEMNVNGRDHGQGLAKLQTGQTSAVTGPGAAAIKYDILTALLTLSLHNSDLKGRLAGRLALVITARLDWRSLSFNVGLRELAKMWGVTERTAKREMAQLRALGWISVVRPAARGRVARHKLDLPKVMTETRPYWAAVGPDFEARMSGPQAPDPSDKIVPIGAKSVSVPAADGTLWPQVAAQLNDENPGLFAAWYSKMTLIDEAGGQWHFAAPSKFTARYIETHLKVPLMAAIGAVDPSIRAVEIVAAE